MMDMKWMESVMGKYEREDQLNIITALKVFQAKESEPNSDPLQFHICLGEKIRAQESELTALLEELENSKEQNLQKEKAIKDLKNELKQERDNSEDLELDMNGKEDELKHLQKCLKNRDEIMNGLDIIIKERNEDISQFRQNNTSRENQVVEGFKLEKKVEIQNNIIKELKNTINDKENMKNSDISKEIKDLLKEIEEVKIENKEKEALLERLDNEKEILKEKLKTLEEKNKEFDCHESLKENVSLYEELSNSSYLNITKPFKCERCDKLMCSMRDLSQHMKNYHEGLDEKEAMEAKLKDLEWTICQQKLNLATSLYTLKENELKENQMCRCRGWCGINHQKYGWKVSQSEEILTKMKGSNK